VGKRLLKTGFIVAVEAKGVRTENGGDERSLKRGRCLLEGRRGGVHRQNTKRERSGLGRWRIELCSCKTAGKKEEPVGIKSS